MGNCFLLEITKSKSFLNLSIPPCLFQFHCKYKKNSILIENKYTSVETYLKVIKICLKNWTLLFDITQTLKENKLLFEN